MAKAFRPSEVPESNATVIPQPYTAQNQTRFSRRLGDFAGLKNFGVNLTRIPPGGQSSYLHAHATQDEFMYVLEGEATLETGSGSELLTPGMCVGFPAGTGEAHRFLNRTDRDVLILVVGDRSSGDILTYPDIDLHGVMGPDGRYRWSRKTGTAL